MYKTGDQIVYCVMSPCGQCINATYQKITVDNGFDLISTVLDVDKQRTDALLKLNPLDLLALGIDNKGNPLKELITYRS